MYKIRREGSFVLITGDSIDDFENAVRYVLRSPCDRAFMFDCDIRELNVYVGPLNGSTDKKGEKASSG